MQGRTEWGIKHSGKKLYYFISNKKMAHCRKRDYQQMLDCSHIEEEEEKMNISHAERS
jgi:hypothetical protein